MLGIMLARPVAGFITELASWHAVFLLSAVAMLALIAVLAYALPARQPDLGLSYGNLLISMGRLVRDTPALALPCRTVRRLQCLLDDGAAVAG
ncbi:hypothetical protein [Acinetobacter sp. WZC-1]|uniref:hypothetical protein n=1 Tax=Acinetobacter sp. WZC-1 TaxID=3459034 RepID=UPI00403D7671